MDSTIREAVLVGIANAIEQGVEPMPLWDDEPEVQELYHEEVERFKTQYGREHGMTYSEVLAFEVTWGISVIELDYRRHKSNAEFQSLPWWEKTPETDMGG